MKKALLLLAFLSVFVIGKTEKAMAWTVGQTRCVTSQECETLTGIIPGNPVSIINLGPLPNAKNPPNQCSVRWANGYQLVQWAMPPDLSCSIFNSEPLGTWSINNGTTFVAPVVPTN